MENITLNFVGDVMLGELFEDYKKGVKSKIIKKNINPFRYCKKEFEKSDLNIANLECVISDQSNREKPFSELLRVPAGFVNILRDNNIHVVNLANNHALDHGIVAFNEMIDVLNNNGIRTFGYSLNKYFQDKPSVINIKRTKLGFIGYNLANLSDTEISRNIIKINKIITSAREEVDVLVLSLHWAYEHVNFPASKFVNIGKSFIEKGVDILYGHHSHQLQGVIKYKSKIFAPSLGNFIFGNSLEENRVTSIMQVKVNHETLRMNFELIPYFINRDFQPEKRTDLLPTLLKVNKILQTIAFGDSSSSLKWDKKAYRRSQLGHLENRIRMRLLFTFHIIDYYPYVWKILKQKLIYRKVC